MTDADAIAVAGQQALWTALVLAGPLLGTMLVVGLIVSMLQAMTQVQEAVLAFVPKLVVLGLVLLAGSSAGMGVMNGFTLMLFDRIVAVGGAP
jgi:flagellar biosynthetic protein FliQ